MTGATPALQEQFTRALETHLTQRGERVGSEDAPASSRFARMSDWQRRRRLVEVESEIADLEAELERVTQGLAAPAKVEPALLEEIDTLPGRPPTDVEIVTNLGTRHAVIESELLELLHEWHELSDLVQG